MENPSSRAAVSMNALLILLAIASIQPKRVNKAIELLEQGQPVYYDDEPRRLRGRKGARRHLGGLHQLRARARRVRRDPAPGVHARSGRRRAHGERTPDAGGRGLASGARSGRGVDARQLLGGAAGARFRSPRRPPLPCPLRSRGARLRRCHPVPLSHTEGRARDSRRDSAEAEARIMPPPSGGSPRRSICGSPTPGP